MPAAQMPWPVASPLRMNHGPARLEGASRSLLVSDALAPALAVPNQAVLLAYRARAQLGESEVQALCLQGP